MYVRIGYIRVSTVAQNLGRQREDLKKYDIEKWFEDKVSGKNTEREGFKNMMPFVRLLLASENIVKTGEPIVRFDGERLKEQLRRLLERV